jgi:YidC/Oxa1 family membrane protein insertase
MNPLDLLETPLRKLLEFLHEHGNLTYGWSIVVLTMIVRSALLPLVIKQYRSMRQMQIYAPQLKELQRKYKGDRPKQQEELMKFYRENQINPFASCLPLVAQFPIFIALYYVLRDFSKTAGQDGSDLSFMWVIPDITRKLTEIGSGAFVIVAIYGISQLLSSELSHTVGMPESQRRMMRVIPVVVVIFVFQFPVPTGLVLYWMTTNLWTAGQQLVMRHKIGLHLAEHPEEGVTKRSSRAANGASGDDAQIPPKKPGLLGRLLTPPAPPTNGTPAIGDAADVSEASAADEPDDLQGEAGVETTPPIRPPRPNSGPRPSGNARRRPRAGGPGQGGNSGKRRPPKKKR